MPDIAVSLHWVDYAVLIAYLAVMVFVGLYHSGKQDSLEQFFLAKRGMSWIPVGISLMAALNSGLDYINTPSTVINFGWLVVLSNISWLIVYPYVFYIILPMFRRLNVVSIYEYLGLRFGEGIRTLTAAVFLFWRLGWMATALYVPCLAFTTAIGRPDLLPRIIILVGVIVTFYTMMGGIKAVIWNDVAQFAIMMIGLVLTVVIVFTHAERGMGAVLSNFFHEGIGNKPNPAIHGNAWWGPALSYLSIPMVLPAIILMWIMRLVGFTSDQIMIQRFATARSLAQARKSFSITAISDTLWMVLLFIVGLGLATYLMTGGQPPEWVTKNPDRIFPYFMATVFPRGVTGIVIAAILAASLSSIDSALNSMTTILMVDFHQRIFRRRRNVNGNREDGRRQVMISRFVTVLVGALGISLSIYAERMGTLFVIANTLGGAFSGPILGIFWLAMFTQRATLKSTVLGTICGTGAAGFLAILAMAVRADKLHSIPLLHDLGLISSIWIPSLATGVTLVVGYLFGSAHPDKKARQWNWLAIVGRPLREEAPEDEPVKEPVASAG